MSLDTNHITGNDQNQSISSGGVHTNPTAPNTYPPQPLAGVHIAWGVMTKLNSPGTSSINERFFCDTNLTNYPSDVLSSATTVFTYVAAELARPADIEVHWSVRLDNPTAPPVARGAYPMAKMHRDGHLSQGNINSVDDIASPITETIAYLQEVAKY